METENNAEAQPVEEQGSQNQEQAEEKTEKSTEDVETPSTFEASETPAHETAGDLGEFNPPKDTESKENDSTSGIGSPKGTPTELESESAVAVSASVDQDKDTDDPTPEHRGPAHVFNDSWSKLSKEVLVDKIRGVIYGQAIGDAFGIETEFHACVQFVGLATEFLSRKAARKHYKTGPKGYSDIIQDFHRSRYNDITSSV